MPEISTMFLLIALGLSTVFFVLSRIKIRQLEKDCKSLMQANTNYLKTFPDIKTFVTLKQQTVEEPAKLQMFRAVRSKGAPDIAIGDINEVIIVAEKRSTAMELLRDIRGFEDDGWWLLMNIQEEKVLEVKRFGGEL